MLYLSLHETMANKMKKLLLTLLPFVMSLIHSFLLSWVYLDSTNQAIHTFNIYAWKWAIHVILLVRFSDHLSCKSHPSKVAKIIAVVKSVSVYFQWRIRAAAAFTMSAHKLRNLWLTLTFGAVKRVHCFAALCGYDKQNIQVYWNV